MPEGGESASKNEAGTVVDFYLCTVLMYIEYLRDKCTFYSITFSRKAKGYEINTYSPSFISNTVKMIILNAD